LKAPAQDAGERRLVEAAQKDPRRFAELYENNFARVYAYVARRVRNREEAQDLTAEVFHQALANLGRFEWRGLPFSAWLMRIASNAIADRWKLAAREHGNPTPGESVSKNISPEENRAARQAVPFGGNVARRSAAGNRDAIRTGEKHQRNCQRAGANGRRDKTIAIPRAGEFAHAVRGFGAEKYSK
jgi:RNA polymerase sigma factor (sigma-70 family)